VAAYQLAVVVDDGAMGIGEIVRGDDLLSSTPRQIALHRALGQAVPRFAHVPLLLDEGGERLAKRTRPVSLASLRDGGTRASEVVARLAASAGLWPAGRPTSARELLDATSDQPLWPRLTRTPGVWPRS
jgi:glutamyl-tRNA synthetase